MVPYRFGPKPGPRPGRALPLAFLALTLLVTGAGPGSAAGSVTVSLHPVGSASLAQGLPFTLNAIASNPDPKPATVYVVFSLSQQGGAAVNAELWFVTVPGLGSAELDLTLTPAQWFAGIGSFHVTPLITGQQAGNVAALEVLAPPVVVPRFEDVTEEAGLSTVLPGPECYRFGTGAAWGDVDGDGLLDLYVPAEGPAQLWMQDGPGHFTEEATDRGVVNEGRVGMGAVFIDFDDDGDQDLYVTNDGPNRLYRNDGTGYFVDVAPVAGVDDSGPGPSSSWADYDGDGNLDLYVTNYGSCSGAGKQDKLYHNEGNGTFSDQTALLGPPDITAGQGFQAAWFDLDHDGDQDLYLANDKLPVGVPGNKMWRNDGPGPQGSWLFTDVSEQSGTDWVMSSMGIGISDYDRDLDLDFAVSDIQGNLLARNNGDGTFTDVAADAGVLRPFQFAGVKSITWGLAFYDFNLDTWEDLYVAAGETNGTGPQPNQLFVNDTAGRFLDLSAPGGADDPGTSRGVAFADYDQDGRVDFYVVDQQGSPRLYHNVTPMTGLHWLEVRTVGTRSTRDGCGTRLTLSVGGATLLREVLCGSVSLSSGADATVHFGLGPATRAGRLVVEWPSGARQILRRLAADRHIVVTEPAS